MKTEVGSGPVPPRAVRQKTKDICGLKKKQRTLTKKSTIQYKIVYFNKKFTYFEKKNAL